MAAQENPNVAVPYAEYQSEDEDSTIEYDENLFPNIDDPRIVLSADPTLQVEGWMPRDASDWESYTPGFTRPGYDDEIEVTEDGKLERPRRGEAQGWMRPAILPTDPPASQYARRFGFFPDLKLNEKFEARSLLTPIHNSTANPRQDDINFEWEFEQSFQATCFLNFTTKELSDLGAFDPTLVVQRPDLQGDLHELITRDKWTQEPLHDQGDAFNLNFWYNLNGEKKPWDVQQNDELWNALQPSLQLVTKVLRSEHPFWKAISSIYHMRPVPIEKDGRTQKEKADPTYRPYVSIWYEIDRDKMYPAARPLMDQNFDSTAATLEVLRRLLKFSVSRGKVDASASTIIGGYYGNDRWLRTVVDASNIWPLLVQEYSVSEKTSVSFYVAKLILHELAHAARTALSFIVIFPDILVNPSWTPPSGTPFNENIRKQLESLCFEAFKLPPSEHFCKHKNGISTLLACVRFLLSRFAKGYDRTFIAGLTKSTSFQDVPQLEEGKAFEHQLFGYEIVSGPSISSKNNSVHPITGVVAWPWKHPMVHVQNQKSVDAGEYGDYTTTPYQTYLLDPPASAYDLYTPVPVKSYAKFMQQSWWENDFIKFGHQGLKIPIHSTDPSSPLKTTARSHVTLNDFAVYLTSVIRSRVALAFISVYAVPRLLEHGQIAILNYLSMFTQDAAAAEIMRNRLHYEKRTWPTRLRGINDLSSKSTQSFDTTWNDLTQKLQRPLSENTAAEVIDVVMKIRELLAHLTELNRLLGVEIQYSQALASQYILKTPVARRKIHRRYMGFLQQNLVQMRSSVLSMLDKVAPRHEQGGELVWKTIGAPWEARFIFMVETNPATLNSITRQQVNESIDALTNIRKYTQQTCGDLLSTLSHMENILSILGDQYIDFPIATLPRGLFPGVPIATKMMEQSEIMEKRAIYETVRLEHPILKQIVGQWLRILATHLGLSDRIENFRDDVKLGMKREKTISEIQAVMIILFDFKRREVDPNISAVDGHHPRDLLVDALRGQVVLLLLDDEIIKAALRDMCIEEEDPEEFDNIIRMFNGNPSPQGPTSHKNA